jgi:hypothetical protein
MLYMRVDLPPDTSLHVASGLDVSLRGDGVHVRPRHRTKGIVAALLCIALSGAGGFIAGTWDKVVTASAESAVDPASMLEPVARQPGLRSAAAQTATLPQAPQTVVTTPPTPAAGRPADPFGLSD